MQQILSEEEAHSTVNMNFANRTEPGVKGYNQDALGIPPHDINQDELGSCLAVADGITLCPKGGEVAQAAVNIVNLYYEIAKDHGPGEQALDLALEKLWENFFTEAETAANNDFLVSGSTLTVALIFRDLVYVRHMGDSHCDIFLPDGEARRLTEEHNTPDGCLINYFGGELQTPAQEITAMFPKGSRIILSSDGISYFISPESISNIAENLNWDAEELIQELFSISIQAGCTDDRTLVLGY